ncbi:SDR family oxidoreductase [Myxococcota bacterium]|nr:SDR family oxidoreductase [Myxococcota bacterium]MBU1896719.1 SDR family oxidoreductase [Myxococcota bacterium]
MIEKNGKVVLITGANKGLGKEIARQLGGLGYTVVLTARDEEAGQVVVDALCAEGHDAHAVRLEVTNPEHIANVATYLEEKFGKLDVLINNAGISLEWDGQPSDVDKLRRTLEVNTIAPFAITERLIPLLAKSEDARVINHSSGLGSLTTAENAWDQVSDFMAPGYSSSKAALNMITIIHHKRLAPQGIIVGAAHPGWVKTDLGTSAAPTEVADGAKTVVSMVTVARDAFPAAQMTHMGKRLPW